MGLHVLYGTIFLVIGGSFRLRPVYRNDAGTNKWAKKLAKLGGKRSWFPRPACGDDAMLWKEMYVSRTGGVTKVDPGGAGRGDAGSIGYSGYWMLLPAIEEIRDDGYFMYGNGPSRVQLLSSGASARRSTSSGSWASPRRRPASCRASARRISGPRS